MEIKVLDNFKVPVVRLRIGEVRGFVLITGHSHSQWLRDRFGEYLPGFDEVLKQEKVGVWAWSREVWYGGPIDNISAPGPYLEVREGQGCWEIDWGTVHGFEFSHVSLFRAVKNYEELHLSEERVKIPDLVDHLQELLHSLSVYDPYGMGLLLISLPHGFRFVLENEPVLLRLYVEGNRSLDMGSSEDE